MSRGRRGRKRRPARPGRPADRVSAESSGTGGYGRLLLAFGLLALYTLLLWGNLPGIHAVRAEWLGALRERLPLEIPSYPYWVLVSAVHFLVIPFLVGRLVLRMPLGQMGIRGLSRPHLAVLGGIYLICLPVLLWLGTRPGLLAYYAPYIESGLFQYLLWTNLVMIVEHAALQGILVSILEPRFFQQGRWRSLRDALRVPRYYLVVFLLDGALFALIHVGKPLVEVLIAFPAGAGLAFLAYRFQSFLPCYLLHTMTAGTIIATLVLMR